MENLAKTTHHYCDIFTDQLLAPLGELVFVRIDENTAEKVSASPFLQSVDTAVP